METDIVIEPAKDAEGVFCWRFTIDGETYADGQETSREDAMRKARMARMEWEDRNQ
jgi:dsRNA-specific ribonuclease